MRHASISNDADGCPFFLRVFSCFGYRGSDTLLLSQQIAT
jgi:hypothetical protein